MARIHYAKGCPQRRSGRARPIESLQDFVGLIREGRCCRRCIEIIANRANMDKYDFYQKAIDMEDSFVEGFNNSIVYLPTTPPITKT